jgi:hypothetical protein
MVIKTDFMSVTSFWMSAKMHTHPPAKKRMRQLSLPRLLQHPAHRTTV